MDAELGVEVLIPLLAYLAGTLAIGLWANRRRPSDSAREYFLGGKLTGALVLFFTMQATQYSGNAFFGFTGMAYRSGLIWILVVPLISLIITVQVCFAPRLYVLSKLYDYVTPADYYADRFGSRALRLAVAALSILSLLPYLMIQTLATGHAFAGLTGGRYPFWYGVVLISAVVLAYVLLGGWRSVVWTDTLQGLMLTAAMLVSVTLFVGSAGGTGAMLEQVRASVPERFAAPPASELTSWLSLLIVSAIGFAMYPQAIHRIYAARSERALRLGLGLMACVPFVLGTCTLLVGLAGLVHYPGLMGSEADQVFALMLRDAVTEHRGLVIFVLCGVLAGVMSTTSSVVLSLAAIFTRDIYQSLFPADARNQARVGRYFTAALIGCTVIASLEPGATLWRLTEIKVEFLMQLFPALILGLYWKRYSRVPALAGLAAGTLLPAGMLLAGYARWGPFHAGLLGMLLNFAVGVAVAALARVPPEERERTERRFFEPFAAVP